MSRTSEFWKIVGLCSLASVLYGIAHDQVTARICIEYFTVFHPTLVASNDPTIQGLVWGVVATIWMGMFLGVLVGLACVQGRWPMFRASRLRRPLVILLLAMALSALIAGLVGWKIGEPIARMAIQVGPPETSKGPSQNVIWIPKGKARAFAADLAAHNASYFVGFWGGIGLGVYALLKRRKLAPASAGVKVM